MMIQAKFIGRHRKKASKKLLSTIIEKHVNIGAVVLRVCKLLGIRFKQEAFGHLFETSCKFSNEASDQSDSSGTRLGLRKDHIESIDPIIKHTHRVSFEEGTALSRLALCKTNPKEIVMLFNFAYQKYVFFMFIISIVNLHYYVSVLVNLEAVALAAFVLKLIHAIFIDPGYEIVAHDLSYSLRCCVHYLWLRNNPTNLFFLSSTFHVHISDCTHELQLQK